MRKKIINLILILLLFLYATPILYTSMASFFSPIYQGAISENSRLSIEHYNTLILTHDFAGAKSLLTTLIISCISAAVTGLSLFSIAFLIFTNKQKMEIVALTLFIFSTIPTSVFVVGYMTMMFSLYIPRSIVFLPMILSGFSLPICALIYIFTLHRFHDSTSSGVSLKRLYLVDKLNIDQYFFHIVWPSTRVSFIFCCTLSGILASNEYIFSHIFSTNSEFVPMTVLLGKLEQTHKMDWGPLFAGLTISIVVAIAAIIGIKCVSRNHERHWGGKS